MSVTRADRMQADIEYALRMALPPELRRNPEQPPDWDQLATPDQAFFDGEGET